MIKNQKIEDRISREYNRNNQVFRDAFMLGINFAEKELENIAIDFANWITDFLEYIELV